MVAVWLLLVTALANVLLSSVATAQNAQHAFVAAIGAGEFEPRQFDPSERTAVLPCDRHAAYRHDRHRLAPPRDREEIDVAAAIAACLDDLESYPDDARLHYQLGRLYGYAGDDTEATRHREASASAGYPSAIYLLGYLAMQHGDGSAIRCAAGQTMRIAARRGGYAARVGFSAYVLQGRFVDCDDMGGDRELASYLQAARNEADGYFELLLVEQLSFQLKMTEN